MIKHDSTIVQSRCGKLPVRREPGCRHHVLALHPVHDSSHTKHGGSERTASTASHTDTTQQRRGGNWLAGLTTKSAVERKNNAESAVRARCVLLQTCAFFPQKDNQPSQAITPNVSQQPVSAQRLSATRRALLLYPPPVSLPPSQQKKSSISVFSLALCLCPSLSCIVSPTIRDLPEPKALVKASCQEDVVVERMEMDGSHEVRVGERSQSFRPASAYASAKASTHGMGDGWKETIAGVFLIYCLLFFTFRMWTTPC